MIIMVILKSLFKLKVFGIIFQRNQFNYLKAIILIIYYYKLFINSFYFQFNLHCIFLKLVAIYVKLLANFLKNLLKLN